ncbi:metallophosphoesterase [Culicoidibacter larvae]|uniref:Metallophosphoesterase n=1 Tax=Culicoidibacter larvae TaxID=2579976 RepID=A0A5R8QBV1_9FIRM|nr:hypothetical protein [Culicoidibacter larvae]TLG73814.1 hypothetical protein FEZ08_06685 [Culicoidibacter larvae]
MKKIFLRTLIIASLILLSISLYGYFVEPKLLTTTYNPPINSAAFPESFNYTKVGVLTDPMVGNNFSAADLGKAVEAINNQEPDIIFFTGGLISPEQLANIESSEMTKILSNLQAPLGKYAVLGKSDVDESGKVKEILKASGFLVLEDSTKYIYNQTDNPVILAGFNPDTQPGDILDKLNSLDQNIPVIVLAQNPNTFLTTSKAANVKLQISGYNHGGQIGIPFLNTLFIPKDSNSNYIKGWYIENESYLYVSGGLGNVQGFPVRIFNWPAVDILQL